MFSVGNQLNLSVSICAPVLAAFDAYILADTPIGLYTIYLDGTVKKGVRPVAEDIPRIGAPYSWTVLNNFPVSSSIRGTTVIYAVIVYAGVMPPVSDPSELRPDTPGVITFDLQEIEVR